MMEGNGYICKRNLMSLVQTFNFNKNMNVYGPKQNVGLKTHKYQNLDLDSSIGYSRVRWHHLTTVFTVNLTHISIIS